jgi:hypothetical protein
VLARFLPRDQQFFTHFAAAGGNALATVRLLAEIVEFSTDASRVLVPRP